MTDLYALPQAEHWVPQDPQLRAVLAPLQKHANTRTPYSMEGLDSVGILELERANCVAFLGATPHTDKNFDRWFILYTLHNPTNSQLHTARKVKPPKNRPLKSDLSVPMTVGEICLFDAHRLHWVDRPNLPEVAPPPGLKERDQQDWLLAQYRDQMSVMVATETPVRPTREEAEQLLATFLRQATPGCWEIANAPKPRKAPRPR